MKIQTKLITLCLAISLIPVSVVGGTGIYEMQEIGSHAQEQSTTHMEEQITGELNNTVSARQEQIQNVMDVRRVDARSLADSSPVQNYQAAKAGEWDLVQRQSRTQLGHIALQMQSTVESTKRTVLEEQYGGKRWEELTPEQRRQVERKVERILTGTNGDGVRSSGTLSKMFHPGYIGNTGYAYIADRDSNIVAHHSLRDGYNLREDASLTAFEGVESTVQSNPAVRNGEEWGIAEYDWEDTTQAGNPLERKFIAYSYHEDFDWVLAPNVYYYELQTTAKESAKDRIDASFRSYLNTRSVSIDGSEMPAYGEIILTGENGEGVTRAYREDGEVVTESVEGVSYADSDWFTESKGLKKGEVGKGFAVVANEIKTLANEAEDATEDVEALITEIQEDTDETVGDMRSMQERVETGAETIENAIEMFDDIADASQRAEDGVREISESTEAQATSTEEVVSMVDEVSSVSEETTSQTSTVSAATEEQTASINEVRQNIQNVSASAQSLQELVNQFEVGEHDGTGSVGANGAGTETGEEPKKEENPLGASE